MRIGRLTTCLAVIVVALIAAAPADARKPVVSYVDGELLKLYDLELDADVAAPAISLPGPNPRYALSLDGRYVFWVEGGGQKTLHLFDRATAAELPLPGIDVFNNPGGLTVANTGLVAFDDNSNGPAVVYDSAAGAFVDVGLDAANGHRQTRLSGNGLFLATTCVTGCEVDLGGDASAYVQDLAAKADTGFPDNLTGADDEDEEHPCINGDGSLVGIDITNPMQRDIFLYDRTAGAAVPLPGLNDPAKEDTSCVLDSSGNYLGYLFDNSEFRIYERSSTSFLTLPARPFSTMSSFTDPFPPSGKLMARVRKRQKIAGPGPAIKARVLCVPDCRVRLKATIQPVAPKGEDPEPLLRTIAHRRSVPSGQRRTLRARISRNVDARLSRLSRRDFDFEVELDLKARFKATGAVERLSKSAELVVDG